MTTSRTRTGPNPRIKEILESIRALALEYYELTGKPMGVTGEIAEYEAARLLGLNLCEARQSGYDALRRTGRPRRIQIKGRRLTGNRNPGQRIGAIRSDAEWDSVMLVLLNEQYEPIEIHEAERAAVLEALARPGSRVRNERGQLGLAQFKAIARCVWPRSP